MTSILKKTKSICPTCLIKIEAKVIEKNNKVYMIKKCPKHGKFTVLVEKDVEFYKKTMNKYPVNRKRRTINLMIPFTHKCNLNCNFCWLPQKNRKDFSIDYLKKVISNSDFDEVRISGGEPTQRNDLPELIKFIRKNKKISGLLTNGIKLANLDYVKKLKDAGLSGVCFSFNTFNDDVYKKLNGQKLLKVKLKALENLKNVGLPVSFSVMLVKGDNDKELREMLNYCLENNSFIYELRIRSPAPFGKYIKSEKIFVSEMINMFSKILGINRKEFIKSIDKKDHSPCRFTGDLYFLKEGNRMYSCLYVTKKQPFENMGSIIEKITITLKLLSKFKIKSFFKIIRNKIRGEKTILHLRLELRTAPNKYNIDWREIERCPSSQLSKNGVFPFCYSLILNNENIIEL